MHLLIVSHTEHYLKNGMVVGWGPTIREINHLAKLFDQVTHVAFLYHNEAPISSLPYAPNVKFVTLRPSGGVTLLDKLRVIFSIPAYIRTILKELNAVDVVHIRCPANISLIAIILFALLRKPRKRWVKYAGDWVSSNAAWSYRFQRWWLRQNLTRAVVTINGEWANTPKHIQSFYNPSLTADDIQVGHQLLETKHLTSPIRLIFVGRVEQEKGIGRALQIVSLLSPTTEVHFDIIGDGKDRATFEQQSRDLEIDHLLTFHGHLPITELGQYYTRAHFLLLPTNASEGWPKVISEGMAYGVVPLIGSVSSIPQYISTFGTGCAIDPLDLGQFVQAIQWYQAHPDEWKLQAQNGVQAARFFTYEYYLEAVRMLLNIDSSQFPRFPEPNEKNP
ncbi:MAG: glycosyltransferase family 4 protein [Anaerolineales bacterium]|nr:glycosyltransferase family 4 protein [Anaerolineales bacterium]